MAEDLDREAETTQFINVDIYDTHSSSTILKINSSIKSIDICRAIAHKIDLSPDEAKYYDLVLIVSMTNSKFSSPPSHCVRTLKQNEHILDTLSVLMSKLLDKYNPSCDKGFKSEIRWFYKDERTSPIDLGDSGEVFGEYSSDEDEPISHSDLAYLAKAERKGYMLKKSSKDAHLWRRWYCVLTDHMWCIDVNKEPPRAICVRLSGMMRQKDKHISLTSLQCIVINSLKRAHYFRAFNLQEQQKWVDELMLNTAYASDNDLFSMAEYMISDEETTRSQRMQKNVAGLLSSDACISLLVDTNDVVRVVLADHTSTSKWMETEFSHDGGDEVVKYTNAAAVCRSYHHFMVHNCHSCNASRTEMIAFLIEVQHYRELFRHDLFVATRQQQMAAVVLYAKYVLPQVYLRGTTLHTDDFNAINYLLLRADKLNMLGNHNSFISGSEQGLSSSNSGNGTANGTVSRNGQQIIAPSSGTSSRATASFRRHFPVYNMIVNKRRTNLAESNSNRTVTAAVAAGVAAAGSSHIVRGTSISSEHHIESWGCGSEAVYMNVHSRIFAHAIDSALVSKDSAAADLSSPSSRAASGQQQSNKISGAQVRSSPPKDEIPSVAAPSTANSFWLWPSTKTTTTAAAAAAKNALMKEAAAAEVHFERLTVASADCFDELAECVATWLSKDATI